MPIECAGMFTNDPGQDHGRPLFGGSETQESPGDRNEKACDSVEEGIVREGLWLMEQLLESLQEQLDCSLPSRQGDRLCEVGELSRGRASRRCHQRWSDTWVLQEAEQRIRSGCATGLQR